MKRIVYVALIGLCLSLSCYAAEGSTSGGESLSGEKGTHSRGSIPDNGNELTITADKAVWDKKQGVTVLSGKVVVSKGKSSFTADTVEIIGQMGKIKQIKGMGNVRFNDMERNIVMTADRIELKESDWEKQITAFGKLRITHGETVVEANTAVYYQNQQKIVLTGEAAITQEKGKLSGKKIIYYLGKKGEEGEEGEERVEVIEGVRAWWQW
ncbi:MAG: LptA/OstA family protein [Candidatus Desantisbacteria bacterium]